MVEFCSYCNQNSLNCHCEQFHPNIRIEEIYLSKPEAENLYNFLLNCGYISYEKWPEIHTLFTKLRKELGV